MTEQIGKVKLDYSQYPGEDKYCDGSVEDELLEIVKNTAAEEYGDIIREKKSWPVLYHLSPLRENIVEWIPFTGKEKVLEVGSGCGAVTGVLSRKAASVACVDLSKKRSLINAHRHSECGNVTIHVGNFQDIEPNLAADFDYICLIGVFEYGQGYMGGKRPYEDFLERLKRHLAPGGRILIAIENQYGLKYFAGCREDHVGQYFAGIEGYPDGGVARTFSRPGLEEIFQKCGLKEYSFYYPYPDYKFMTALYSDRYLPGKGELSNNMRNFDGDRMLLFDEKQAFDGIVQDGLFSVFANSYLAVLGPGFPQDFVKYSNDRAPQYQIKTVIFGAKEGEAFVCKYPLTYQAREHIREMARSGRLLTERYKGSGLRINPCSLMENGEEIWAQFPFEKGKPLSELMDERLQRQDIEGWKRLFDGYVERIGYHEGENVSDFDPVFSNLLADGEEWTLIDYEWTFERAVETRELAFRAVHCYLLEDERRNRLELSWVLEKLGITREEAEGYRRQEREFQRFVTGNRLSMGELWATAVRGEVLRPLDWIPVFLYKRMIRRVQIYEDRGNGYSEESSRFLENSYQTQEDVAFEIWLDREVRRIRIDPAMEPCVCKVLELSFGGTPIPLRRKETVAINGRRLRTKGAHLSFLFPTKDPWFDIDLSALESKGERRLKAKMKVAQLPLDTAEELSGALKGHGRGF